MSQFFSSSSFSNEFAPRKYGEGEKNFPCAWTKAPDKQTRCGISHHTDRCSSNNVLLQVFQKKACKMEIMDTLEEDLTQDSLTKPVKCDAVG